MKRAVIFFSMLLMLFAFSGCNILQEHPANTESVQTTIAPTEATTEPTISDSAAPPEAPMVSVSMQVVWETEFADDGTEIFSYVYQNMSLILPESEISEKIILDYLNRVDMTSTDAETIKSASRKNYTAGNWTPYLCQIKYNPVRIDRGVLSLLGNYTTYNGAPHPVSADISLNYDLVTGDEIQLKNIISANATETLISEVTKSLDSQKEDKGLFDDFAANVRDRFSNGLTHEYSWYFSNTGLCFYFSAYDIAPYSAGVIIAEVPYEKLAGLMDDAYFPAEPEVVTGTLLAEHFNEDNQDRFNNYSEIVIDKGFIKALLYTDSSVCDLRIEIGSWSADDIFIPEHTVYAANVLTSNDAIVIESEIPDTLPRLRVTYYTGDTSVSVYLADSGEDGSILLIQE